LTFWFMQDFRERLASAWRAFQGDRWVDPAHVAECERAMAGGAIEAIHRLLDSGGIPRGAFADDHVQNLVALYKLRGEEIALLRELPPEVRERKGRP
jgi:hypothetical protein